MNRREIERRLKALGREPAPGPTEEFVEGLAGHLRSEGVARRRARGPVFRTGFALAAATALVAVALAGALVVRSPAPDGSLQLAGTTDAVVVLPDGTEVAAVDGLVIPEGAVVRTGPAGQVRADGQRLGPNREARVRAGRFIGERERPAPAAAPTERPRPTPTATPRPVDDTAPAPTRPPTPRPTAEPTRPPADSDLRLECEPVSSELRSGIACRWSPSHDPGFRAYVLWRSDGEDRRAVHRTADRSATGYFDPDVRSGVVYTYVVHAIDGNGSTIASGGPVRVRAP